MGYDVRFYLADNFCKAFTIQKIAGKVIARCFLRRLNQAYDVVPCSSQSNSKILQGL